MKSLPEWKKPAKAIALAGKWILSGNIDQ